jgi:hypothetical protein
VTNPHTPKEKGDALQDTVVLIESTILHTAPHLKEKNFTIEPKKIINSDGVHHEIDVYVTVDSAPGYSAIYIFECKNWKDSVGKNEIIAFVEKINCSNAMHGYFVATSFTKDAKAQAEKCSRLTLLHATEVDLTAVDGHQVMFSVLKNVEVILRGRGSKDDEKVVRFEGDTATAEFQGRPFSFEHEMKKLAERTVDYTWRSNPPLPLGEHESECGLRLIFSLPKTFTVNGQDIEDATLKIKYAVTISRPTIKWEFDIEKRGRVLHLETPTADGDRFVAELIFRNS